MTYAVRDYVGAQAINVTSTTQNHPIGTEIKAWDPIYGEGAFIYLLGVASTVVGSTVGYNQKTGVTTLIPNTANLAQPVAFAMSANVAAQWGWYQVEGIAIVKKPAVKVLPLAPVYISSTAGRLQTTAVSGKQIVAARTATTATVASATSSFSLQINRPFAQGAVA